MNPTADDEALFDLIREVAPEVKLLAAGRDEEIYSGDPADHALFDDEQVARILRGAGIGAPINSGVSRAKLPSAVRSLWEKVGTLSRSRWSSARRQGRLGAFGSEQKGKTTMRHLGKLLMGTAALLVALVVVSGRSPRDLYGYLRAWGGNTIDCWTNGLPREVRDKKLENDLAQVRAELVERRVKLSLSARKIEELRADVTTLTARTERDRQLLVEMYPVLAAARGQQATVVFASAKMPLADFQREIDDLLARRKLDAQALAVKREGLARLEKQHRQAEVLLADSQHALEAAEREIELLRARRDYAENEARMIEMIGAISANLKAPQESIGASIGALRDEVVYIETTNEVNRAMAPAGSWLMAGTASREYSRLEDLKAIHAEAQGEKHQKAQAVALQGAVGQVKSAGNTRP
jgi:hypothetical protein